MRPYRLPILHIVLFALISVAGVPAFGGKSFTIGWDASPDPTVVGYYLYYGPAAGTYTNRLDAGTNLSLTTPVLPDGLYYFSLTSRTVQNVESDFSNVINTNAVTAVSIISPVVTTTWPTTNSRVLNGHNYTNGTLITTAPNIPLSGAATNNGNITNITVTRVFPPWAPLSFVPTLMGPADAKTWTNRVALVDGTNSFQIEASDSSGSTGALVRTIFLRTTNRLSVSTNGYGSTAPYGDLTYGSAKSNAWLELGRNYSIKATPRTGNWFVNWTDGGGSIMSTNPTFTFRMTNNLSLTANFVTNEIIAGHLVGSYSGLFAEDSGPTTHSAGSISSFVVASSRSYSGKLFVGGATYLFSGTFDTTGHATKTLLRHLKPSLLVDLRLDFVNGSKKVTGSVSCAQENWSSPLRANLAVYNAANHNPMAGRYTMGIPPLGTSDTNSPVGYGYGVISNSVSGVASLQGALADSSPLLCSAPISQTGEWPICVDLYSHQGLLHGWLNFSNGTPAGRLAWLKPPSPPATNLISKLFPAGIDNAIDVFGSAYHAGTPAVALSSGALELDVSAHSSATYTVSVTNNSIISPVHISGTIASSTGLITLSLPSAVTGGLIRKAYAVVLQSSNAAVGTVTGTNAAIYLH